MPKIMVFLFAYRNKGFKITDVLALFKSIQNGITPTLCHRF